MNQKKKTVRRSIALSLGVIFLALWVFFPHTSYRVEATSTAQELEDARKRKEETETEIAKARENVAALSGDVNALQGELAELAALDAEQKAEYARISAELEAVLQVQQASIDDYVASLENLETKTVEYSKRIGLLMEYSQKSTLEILLSSTSLSGFFSQLEMITLIGEADQQAIEDLEAARDDAALKQMLAEETAAAVQIVADEKRAELEALKNQMDITQANLNQKQSALSEWERRENELEAQSEDLATQIAGLQAALSSSSGSGSVNGSSGSGYIPNGMFIWPCPGGSGSSSYGYRTHPVYGTTRFHAGTDISASYGSKILAAASGTVIVVDTPVPGQNTGGSGYGNFVVIDHGDGVSTLYAHAKNVYVSVGDTVSSGDHIADVGSTGTSTGPHLHFEVRINGSVTDPMAYFN